MYLVSIWIKSPGLLIFKPLGNRAFGLSAARFLLHDNFWLINPRLFKIRPTVLAEIWIPFRAINVLILYLDQAGYCFRNSTTAITVSQGVTIVLKCFGLWERSLSPAMPPILAFLTQRLNVNLWVPNLLEVRLIFCPCFWCQSKIFNLCLALGLASTRRATKAAPGRIDPYIVIVLPEYLPFMIFSSQVDTIIWTSTSSGQFVVDVLKYLRNVFIVETKIQ